MVELRIVADDLTGAVECAAAALPRVQPAFVELASRTAPHDSRVVALDLDSRRQPVTQAAQLAATALAGSDPIVKKIDSLLRGHLAAELTAVSKSHRPIIVAPTLPALRRTVIDGILTIDGTPLHRSRVAQQYLVSPAPSVAAALAPLPVRLVDLETLRNSGNAEMVGAIIQRAVHPRRVCVCDAETDEDLDRIVAAAATMGSRPLLVGSSGIVAAMLRRLPAGPAPDLSDATSRPSEGSGVLLVCGSNAPAIEPQFTALDGLVPILSIEPVDLVNTAGAARISDRIQRMWSQERSLAIRISPGSGNAQPVSETLVATLATIVEPIARGARALGLIGGGTARSVLDALGITLLRVVAQVHHGAAMSVSDTGQRVATRPGSFGGGDSLRLIIRELRRITVLTKENR